MVENYATHQRDKEQLIFKYPKMILAVGNRECEALRRRYEQFSAHNPKLKLPEKKSLA